MGRQAPIEGEALVRTSGDWWLVHGLPLATPPGLCAVYALLIVGAHRVWGGDPIITPLLAVTMVMIGVALTGFSWAAVGSRWLIRLVVAVTGAVATIMMVLGTVMGFRRIWLAYLVCSLVVWALWTIWRGSKYAGTSGRSGGNGAESLFAAIGDAKVQFSRPKTDARGVVTAEVRTLPGGTLADGQALLPAVSAHARGVRGGTTLAPHPTVDGVGRIKIATRDNLAKRIPWPGLARLGALPTEPFAIGERQGGVAQIRILGDYDKDPQAPDLQHLKIGGTTGAGKSTGGRGVLANLVAMRRLNLIACDLSKGLQTFGPLARGFDWAITEEEIVRVFLERMKIVIRGRTAQLASEGLMRWSPRSRLNLLTVWFEESKALKSMQRPYDAMLADARTAGIWVVSSTQRWLHRSVSTDARSLHGAAMLFGAEEYADAVAVLPKEALEAIGPGLQLWGATKPGRAYVTGLGIPAELWGDEVRFYDPTTEQLAEAVDLALPYRSALDDITAELFGELYARRTAPVQQGRHVAVPVRSGVVLSRRPVEQLDNQFDEDDDAEEGSEEDVMADAEEEAAQDRQRLRDVLSESLRAHLGDDARPNDLENVDPSVELTADVDDGGEEPDLDAGPKPSPEEAQRIWDTRLHELYDAGERRVDVAALTSWLLEVQRERTFLYRQRDRWVDGGFLVVREDGEGWDLVASPLEVHRFGPPHGE